MKLLYFLWKILPSPVKNVVKYIYMKGNISRDSVKEVQLTYLINGSVKIGKKARIGHLEGGLSEGLEVGDYTYLNNGVKIYSTNQYKVKIGKYCSIANGTSFIALIDHDVSCLTTNVNPDIRPHNIIRLGESINVQHDVRIGRNSIILKGVNIGTGAVIGAGSVVTKDIPPYAIAVGNPAKIIKYRFDEETINKLLSSERRNRDTEKIKNNYKLEFLN